MEVVLASSAGFCFGVKRAIEITEEQIKNRDTCVYTYGPLIHNEIVVGDLEKKGVAVMDEDASPEDYPPGVVIIRSHGVSKDTIDRLNVAGHAIVDATCPFVRRIHDLVAEHSALGEYIIVLGDREHPEVRGIVGWCQSSEISVISSLEEAKELDIPKGKKVFLVAQTTFNINKFKDFVEILKGKGYDINALNTICNATEERQEEASRIAGEVDAMLVIGGRHSSNSRKLYEICKERCEDTMFIQTAEDFSPPKPWSISKVGITAGASTPDIIIEEVFKKCQN